MHGIRIAEKIVHVSQNFLIGPHQKDTDIISIFSFQRMDRQIMRNIARRNKVSDLAIRIAGYILQSRRPVRPFIQPLDRHDRENLIDRPRVRQRLEKREITEILISQQLVQLAKLIRCMFQAGSDLADLARHRPIQPLDLGAGLQIDNAMTEQIQCLLAYLLRIVPGFQHTALIQLIPNFIQFLHKLMVGFTHFEVFIHFGKRSSFQYFKYQNRMMGCQRTSALRYNIRMRDAVLITDIDHC